MIGHQDQANHQYDLERLLGGRSAGNLPAVSYLKAPGYQDGHAGYSDPLDEQTFLVDTINHLEKLPFWTSTAVSSPTTTRTAGTTTRWARSSTSRRIRRATR